MVSTLIEIATAFWAVLAEMAPWLVLGFLFAGVLSVFVKPAWIARHLAGRGFGPVFKAAVLGVPLPLCSCGVIPVGSGLYRQGASKGASASFLLATPQTGVDSIAATFGLMGPVFGLARPLVALINGFVVGWLIDVGSGDAERSVATDRADASGDGCGSDEANADCCGSVGDTDAERPASLAGKLREALRYGLVTLPADLAWALLIGLVLAGLLTSLIDPGALGPWLGGGVLGMLAAIAIGAPIYVCSTASIPVAVGLMHAGASPGAALAFLIAGPATNLATMGVVGGLLGRRALAIYLGGVLVSALGFGALLDVVTGAIGTMLPDAAMHPHEHPLTGWDHAWAVTLIAILLVGLTKRLGWWGQPKLSGDQAMNDNTSAPPPTELPVEGMTCSHCAGSVESALRAVPGVREVTVDLPGKRAWVTGEAVQREELAAAVRGVGFQSPG